MQLARKAARVAAGEAVRPVLRLVLVWRDGVRAPLRRAAARAAVLRAGARGLRTVARAHAAGPGRRGAARSRRRRHDRPRACLVRGNRLGGPRRANCEAALPARPETRQLRRPPGTRAAGGPAALLLRAPARHPGALSAQDDILAALDAEAKETRAPLAADDDAAFVAFDWPPADGSRAAPLEPTVGQHDRGSSASADESARSLPSESRIGLPDS